MKKIILFTALCSFFLSLICGYTITILDADRYGKPAEEKSSMVHAEPLIGKDTKIIYQYYYNKDKVTKEQIENAPEFLYGLNMKQLESVYDDWQLILFSPKKIILRCKIDGLSSETYIIGEKDGFLAVFYEDAQKGIHLKEMTELPVSALHEDDAKKINAGIRVNGEENLAKILSDWLS